MVVVASSLRVDSASKCARVEDWKSNKFEFMFVNRHSSSSVLDEADLFGLFSESLSAKHELVLSDETEGAASDSAGSGVFAVLSGVRSKLVRHSFA